MSRLAPKKIVGAEPCNSPSTAVKSVGVFQEVYRSHSIQYGTNCEQHGTFQLLPCATAGRAEWLHHTTKPVFPMLLLHFALQEWYIAKIKHREFLALTNGVMSY